MEYCSDPSSNISMDMGNLVMSGALLVPRSVGEVCGQGKRVMREKEAPCGVRVRDFLAALGAPEVLPRETTA